jgi:hypothetical protein
LLESKNIIAVIAAALLVATACSFPLVSSRSEEDVAEAVAETVQAAMRKPRQPRPIRPADADPLPDLHHPSPSRNRPCRRSPRLNVQPLPSLSVRLLKITPCSLPVRISPRPALEKRRHLHLESELRFRLRQRDRMSGARLHDLDQYVKTRRIRRL